MARTCLADGKKSSLRNGHYELRSPALIEFGSDHRLADPEPVEAMVKA